MSDWLPAESIFTKKDVIIFSIGLLVVTFIFLALIGWGLLEAVKAISHAWHQGAR